MFLNNNWIFHNQMVLERFFYKRTFEIKTVIFISRKNFLLIINQNGQFTQHQIIWDSWMNIVITPSFLNFMLSLCNYNIYTINYFVVVPTATDQEFTPLVNNQQSPVQNPQTVIIVVGAACGVLILVAAVIVLLVVLRRKHR